MFLIKCTSGLSGRRYTGESSECSSLVGTPTDTGRSFTFTTARQVNGPFFSEKYWNMRAKFHNKFERRVMSTIRLLSGVTGREEAIRDPESIRDDARGLLIGKK